jgi:surface antigen
MRVFLTFPFFLVAVIGACFTCTAHAGPASSDGRRAVRVKVARYASDDTIDVVARIRTATPHRPCYGRVLLKGRSQRLSKRLTTGKFDGGKWHWALAHHAPGGLLTLKVRCKFADGIPHRGAGHRHVPASIHATSTFRRIIARGTLRTEKWKPPPGHGVGGDGSLYPSHRCTWWVARLRPDLPFFPGSSGDALNWFDAARRRGFPTGTIPRVGSVAVFAPGQYGAGEFGHVAYVKEINGYTITISEANFKHTRDGHERTIKWEGLRFIYHRGETPAQRPVIANDSATSTLSLGENPQRVYLGKQTAPHYMSQPFTTKGHWITGGTGVLPPRRQPQASQAQTATVDREDVDARRLQAIAVDT